MTLDEAIQHCEEKAQGNGEYKNPVRLVSNTYTYDDISETNAEVSDHVKVRKWNDTGWHEPTADYMFGERL